MRKKILYTLLSLFIVVAFLLNYIAYNHAYKFTHYADIKENRLKVMDGAKISLKEKIQYIMEGVNVPRPKNVITPPFEYIQKRISTPKGEIEIWENKIVRKPGRSGLARGTVIFFHGYANKKSSLIARAEEFYDMEYNVVLVDFLGSGGSDGSTCSIGYYEAEQVKACYDYVQAKGEKNIYLFGISMGAAAIMKCVKDHQPDVKGIFLECPFGDFKTTVKNRFRNFGLPTFPLADLLMIWGSYHAGYWTYHHNPSEYAKEIHCPTMLLYGEKDYAVSRKEINTIFKNLQGEKKLSIFEKTGHEIYMNHTQQQWLVEVQYFLAFTGTYSSPYYMKGNEVYY